MTDGVKKGSLYVLEGIDGAGKSTALKCVKNSLHNMGYDVITGFEPGLYASRYMARNKKMRPPEKLFCLMHDRAKHLRMIEDNIAEGRIVLMDRYAPSTLAYQPQQLVGAGLFADNDEARKYLHFMQAPFVFPARMYFLLDIDPAEALKRVDARSDRSEYEQLENLITCRNAYKGLSYYETYGPWKTLDATQPIGTTVQTILNSIVELEGTK